MLDKGLIREAPPETRGVPTGGSTWSSSYKAKSVCPSGDWQGGALLALVVALLALGLSARDGLAAGGFNVNGQLLMAEDFIRWLMQCRGDREWLAFGSSKRRDRNWPRHQDDKHRLRLHGDGVLAGEPDHGQRAFHLQQRFSTNDQTFLDALGRDIAVRPRGGRPAGNRHVPGLEDHFPNEFPSGGDIFVGTEQLHYSARDGDSFTIDNRPAPTAHASGSFVRAQNLLKLKARAVPRYLGAPPTTEASHGVGASVHSP